METDHDPSEKRVLLVEDNAADARLVRELLEESPTTRFVLTNVTRMADALRAISRESFDLILLDLSLPDARGLDTIARALPASGTVPIVVMSGTDDEAFAVRAVKYGAQDYLVKGQIDGRALSRTILYAIERQRMMLDLEQARQREHFLATHDSLTGLPNRPQFYARLSRALSRSERLDRIVAVLFVDLDHFKNINDTHGHALGDGLLRCAAERLKASTRSSDTVARLGGDEFIVLLESLSLPRDAGRVAENILRRLSAPYLLDRHELGISCSVGVAVHPQDGLDAEMLIRSADAAMYRAKALGRNTYQFHSSELNEAAPRRRAIDELLGEALEQEQLVLHYQPMIDGVTGRILGSEALLRWDHPDLGLLPPGEFLDAAEQARLLGPIGDWVLREACTRHREWTEAGFRDLRVAVNLAPSQLRQVDLVRRVEAILLETEMVPDLLELEISERGIMRGSDRARGALRSLQHLGVRISIDDFGTGDTSVGRLKELPTCGVKIDGSFVRGVPGETRLASAILGLAEGLNLEVTAEGVETVEQAEYLRKNRCDRLQGFLFGRAMPAADFLALLRNEADARTLRRAVGDTGGAVNRAHGNA